MNINNAIDAVIFILKPYPVLQGSQIISYMLPARGTGSGKDTALAHSPLNKKCSINMKATTTLKLVAKLSEGGND